MTPHREARRRPQSPRLPKVLLDLAAGREPGRAVIDERVVEIASDHRMTGLLWTFARDETFDPNLKARLAMRDLRIRAHLADVWRVLEACAARLEAAGLEVITIKGVTAEARWYDRFGERPCSDVDLLLAPHEVNRVAEAVSLLEPGHPWLPYLETAAAVKHVQSVTLRMDGLEVDLHLDPLKLGIPTRQASDLWARSSVYPLPGGGKVRVLDDSAALFHLLIHVNKDRFQRLLGYADIARVIASNEISWERLQRLAIAEGLEVPTLRTLEVVLHQLGLPWPQELPRLRSLRASAWQILWHPRIRLLGRQGRLRFRKRQDWLPLLARGRTVEALRWWLREMWPPRPIVRAHYAEIHGPYLWKLVRGRLAAARLQRAEIARDRARRKDIPSGS